ncbi:MAG: AAA family ATPase [Gemmatimonadetes bacterium]|nr:AAA family ATPase [Gemmatimonadota bacterium]
MTGPGRSIFPLPLVGRRADAQALQLALDDALDGRGGLAAVVGESGVGKSRVLALLAEEARTRGARVLAGRGFALEGDRPYGPWTDALTPLIQELGPGLATLARGLERDLTAIVPAIGPRPGEVEDKGHLFWNVGQFLARAARRQPMLVVLEDLHLADTPSIELAHFIGRHLDAVPVLLAVSWVTGTARSATLDELLRAMGPRTTQRALRPLTRADLQELVLRVFGQGGAAAEQFATRLHEQTGGNAFFVEEMLKSMLVSGHLRREGSEWAGLDRGVPETLPSTVAGAVHRRLATLGERAQAVAEAVALASTVATISCVEAVTGLDAAPLAQVLDALTVGQVLAAPNQPDGPYTFTHHIVQRVVEQGISDARARSLHRAIATHLDGNGAHAGASLARHLVRAGLGGSVEALPHLIAAGRDALARRADHEAVRWLGEAERSVRQHGVVLRPTEAAELLSDLARAEWRTGAMEGAASHHAQALQLADADGAHGLRARILRHMASAAAVAGRPDDALAASRAAIDAATLANDLRLEVTARVSTAVVLQSLGRMEEGKAVVGDVMERVEASGDAEGIANAHRALVQLFGWTGPSATARHHAQLALAAARLAHNDEIAWSVHWALAILEGFTGNGDGVREHRSAAERLAESLGSPVRAALTAEVAIEYASATGEWAEARALAGRAIPIARAVAPRTLLPRLLVWEGLVLLAQEERESARARIDEAWELSGAGLPGTVPAAAVQNVVLAHTGRAAASLAEGNWEEARDLGERGLALSDRHGLVAWGIHRLLPLIAEAAMWQQDYDRALEVADRLRRDGVPLQHKLALAWATTIDALVARLRDGRADAAEQLLAAAEQLEAVPFVFHAARARRNAAQVLAADGRVDEAVRELRHAHDVFLRTGAEAELRGTRSALRSLGVRLPPRAVSEGAGALTGRELDIARCVAEHLTNKEIGERLDISARTVSTHLANIFKKVQVDSRAALADLVRADPRFAE